MKIVSVIVISTVYFIVVFLAGNVIESFFGLDSTNGWSIGPIYMIAPLITIAFVYLLISVGKEWRDPKKVWRNLGAPQRFLLLFVLLALVLSALIVAALLSVLGFYLIFNPFQYFLG